MRLTKFFFAFLAFGVADAIAAASTGSAFDKDLNRIRAALEKGDVDKAASLCVSVPRGIIQYTGGVQYNAARAAPTDFLAELLAHCAVAAERSGDAAAASWRWHSAQVFDSARARDVTARLRGGEPFPPPRLLGPTPEELKDREEFRAHATSGEVLEVQPPRHKAGRPLPPLGYRGGFSCEFEIETKIGVDGRLSEPVVASYQHCVPLQVFGFLDSLREWRFEPARRLNGEPVEIYNRVTTHIRRP